MTSWEKQPILLKPLSYALPLAYGVDVLPGAIHGRHSTPFAVDLTILGAFCIALFMASLHNIRRRWII